MPDNYDAGAPESGVPESETPQEPDRGYVPNPQGGVVREPAPQMRVFVDKNGQVQRVNPIQVPDAVSAGWQETDPETAAKITKFSLNPAQQKLMHDSPVTAGVLSFTGNAVPGGRQLLSATTGISPEQQDLLAAENPNASRIGGIAGSLSQAAITLGLTGSPAVMGGIGGGTEALNHEGLTGQINPGEILDKAGAGAVTGELTSAAMPPEEMALPGTQIEQPAEMAKWQQDIQDRLNQTAATKQAVIDSTQKNKSVINEQLNDLMAKHVAEKTTSDASGQKLIKVMQAQNEDARLNWPSMKAKIMQNFASNLPSSVTPEMRQKIIAMQSQLLDNGFNSKMAEKELGANHAADSLSRAADAKYGPQIQEQIKQLELEDSLHKTRTEGLDHYTRSLNQQMQSTKQKLPGMAEGGVIGDNGEIKQLGQPDEVAPGVAPPNEMLLPNVWRAFHVFGLYNFAIVEEASM